MATDIGNWDDFLKSQLQWNAGQNRNLLIGTSDQKPAPTPPVFVNPLTGDDITSKITGGEGGAKQDPTGQPTGYGGFNTGMGRMAGLAGTVAGGIPGLAMSLAGYGLGLGMGRVAPESRGFTPNMLGSYGFNVSTPEDVALAEATWGALDEATRSDLASMANARAASPFGTMKDSIFGGPLAAMTREQMVSLAKELGVNIMGEQPGPMPGFVSMNQKIPGLPGGWISMNPSSTPPGPAMDLNAMDQADLDLGAAMSAAAAQDARDAAPGAPAGAASAGDPSETAGDRGETGGTSDPGDASDASMARGGVAKARKATRATFGEAGPETAIFIPEMMKQLGLQGRERDVIRALREALRDLEGSVKPRKTGRL